MANRTDDFNRTNGAIGTPSDAGSAWVEDSGTWAVSINTAGESSDGSQVICSLSSGTSDVTVQATLAASAGGSMDMGLSGRVADASNYLLFAITAGTGMRIFEVVAGNFNQVGSTDATVPTVGDVLAAEMNGTAVAFKLNGVTKVSGTTSAGLTNTRHGFRAHQDVSSKWDDFSITDIGGGGSSTGAAAHYYRQS